LAGQSVYPFAPIENACPNGASIERVEIVRTKARISCLLVIRFKMRIKVLTNRHVVLIEFEF